MPSGWSDDPIRPEVVIGLEPVWQNVFKDATVSDIMRYPLMDKDGKSLLPPPYTLVWLPPFVLVCLLEEGNLVGMRPLSTEAFVSDDFLQQLRQVIPPNTELAWTAEAGDRPLRKAILDAMQLRKLVRVHSDSGGVYWLWPYYQVHFGVKDLESPNLTLTI